MAFVITAKAVFEVAPLGASFAPPWPVDVMILIINGGLRLHDSATGNVVVPGCCAGLEDWRDWADALSGSPVWLGHDPEPQIEMIGDDLRIRQDGAHRDHDAPSYVDVPRDLPPALLLDVRHDLR
ncbi:hypothetical protein [Actinoplanes sp. NPDC048796]|uniref:hypothetical protein n=1 Tax=Actinoplanes sp. NPDC048796 TaxID=3155640 RepID=UPI0033C3AB00